MNHKIREHVEYLFESAPRTPRAIELKEELISNLIDRYVDLIQQGETEEAAYGIVISGIGDVEELIRALREQDTLDPMAQQTQRQKSAMLVSLSVGLFIVSVIFPIIFGYLSETFGGDYFMMIGVVLMLVCIAVGVGLLVYNANSKPKYVKAEETVVEEFKEWQSGKQSKRNLYKSIQSIVWSCTVPLFLIIGIFFNRWHPGWLVFVLAPVVNHIIKIWFQYREEE